MKFKMRKRKTQKKRNRSTVRFWHSIAFLLPIFGCGCCRVFFLFFVYFCRFSCTPLHTADHTGHPSTTSRAFPEGRRGPAAPIDREERGTPVLHAQGNQCLGFSVYYVWCALRFASWVCVCVRVSDGSVAVRVANVSSEAVLSLTHNILL